MLFFNRYEVEEMAVRTQVHPHLAPFGAVALAYLETIDANSDGWAQGAGGSRPAAKFLTLLQRATAPFWQRRDDGPTPSVQELRRALAPMRALCTKRGFAPLPKA